MNIKSEMQFSFYRGILTVACGLGTFQDIVGVEWYTTYIKDHWSPGPWWLSGILLIAFILLQLSSENAVQKKLEGMK